MTTNHTVFSFKTLRFSALVVAALFLTSCAPMPTAPDASFEDEIDNAQLSSATQAAPELTPEEIMALEPDPAATATPATPAQLNTMFPDIAQGELDQLPPPQTDLWEIIINGYGMPDIEGPLVRKWERWYSERPDYVERMIERSRLYLYHIVHQVEARNMPMEIALLPMIESAYNPNAHSRSRAMGIWQFIPSTGRLYGLKQNWWMDERRDVISATDSALNYLQKLYNDFNDWQLALASYNWGEGNVSRALARNRALKRPQTYTSLRMPAETKNYIPKLQAVKNIIRDPEKFGLVLGDIPDAPYFTVVKTTRKMDVEVAAELAEMTVEEFKDLNPQHNRPVIAGADEFTLLLPIDRADVFASKLDLVDQPLVTWQAYKVRKGETLTKIADKFNSTPEAIRAVNGMGRLAQVRAGYTILVPAEQPSEITEASLSSAVFTTVPTYYQTTYYRVKRGDTLSKISRRFGVSTANLMRWNGLKSAKSLRAGKSIRVAPRSSVASGGSGKATGSKTYRVKKGDTLSKIARNNGVSLGHLLRVNQLDKNSTIVAGQTLIIR
jgi:membrane-bound lytic murein transglycosylase D